MKMKGVIIAIIAPTATGGEEIIKTFSKRTTCRLIQRVTTRSKRPTDIGYRYITIDDFFSRKFNDDFAWTTRHGNNYYGVLKSDLNSILRRESNGVIGVTPMGLLKLVSYASLQATADYQRRVIAFFLAPPPVEELERRVKAAGLMSTEDFRRRWKGGGTVNGNGTLPGEEDWWEFLQSKSRNFQVPIHSISTTSGEIQRTPVEIALDIADCVQET